MHHIIEIKNKKIDMTAIELFLMREERKVQQLDAVRRKYLDKHWILLENGREYINALDPTEIIRADVLDALRSWHSPGGGGWRG